MFSCDPIPGNVNYRARDFHGESYYDIPALTADPRFKDSMRLIKIYSLLPFMSPRQFFYPQVVLEFYHTMTSRGASGQMQLWFSIDGRPGVLRATGITAALSLPVVLVNSTEYRQWPQPSPREMVISLSLSLSLSLSIPQPDLYFFVGNFLRRFSSQTTYFDPICSHCSIIYMAEKLFSKLYTGYHRGSGSAPPSLS